MAFVDWPPGLGVDEQRDLWLRQMSFALDEIAAAQSNGVYSRPSNIWDANEGAALTTTDITDPNKNWAIYRSDLGAWKKRWTEWSDTDPTRTEPTAFDIVLFNLWDDFHGYRNHLRFEIVDQDWVSDGSGGFISHKLTFGGAIDVNVPWFPTMAYYTHYAIIRRGEGGVFVAERVPDWPNDFTLEWANAISSTTASITVDKNKRNWKNGLWTGKYVYFTVAGAVRSALITSNDHDGSGNPVLHFAAVATAPDAAPIGILPGGASYWTPAHQPMAPENEVVSTRVWPWKMWSRWTETVQEYWTRLPDGTMSTKRFPASDWVRLNANPALDQHWDMVGGSAAYDVDRDLFTEPLNEFADPPDWCLNRNFHKTLRSWQATLITDCYNFVPYRSDSYDGWAQEALNNFTEARFMWESQVNAAAGTTGALVLDGGGAIIGVSVTFSTVGNYFTGELPISVLVSMERLVNWTNTAPFGSPPVWVSAAAPASQLGSLILTDQEFTFDGTNLLAPGLTQDVVNQSVWFCFGPTRERPSRFRYFYPKECFVPDVGDPPIGGGESPPVDPPTDAKPGNWVVRPASAQLLDFESHGIAMEPLNGNEYTGDVPTDGELCRYVGDSWDFPTTGIPVTSTPTWKKDYIDNFYEGKTVREAGSRNWDTPARGKVTVVDDALQFGDSFLNLWAAGIMIGDLGETSHVMDLSTASFTGTTITDASHSTSHLWDGSATGRWEGHWMIVWQPGDVGSGGTAGPLHKAKRPIVGYDHTTQTVTFPALAGITSTYSYLDSSNATHTGNTTVRLREPKYEKNMLAGSICELSSVSANAVYTGTVTYSEDDRIRVDGWKDSGGSPVVYTPVVGDGYAVKRVSTGTVWQRSGGNWIKPTGADARGSGSFPDEQCTIAVSSRRRYGRLMPGDRIGPDFYEETTRMRRALKMTQITGVNFTPDADPTTLVADNNAEFAVNDGETGCPSAWNTVSLTSGPTANPFATSSGHPCTFDAQRSCGWPQVALNPGITSAFIPTTLQKLRLVPAGTFLNYATCNPADDLQNITGTPAGENIIIFDNNGDSANLHQWTAFDTWSGDDVQATGSAVFGSVTRPNEAPPDTGSSHSTNQQGYYVQWAVLILDWSGAMTFI